VRTPLFHADSSDGSCSLFHSLTTNSLWRGGVKRLVLEGESRDGKFVSGFVLVMIFMVHHVPMNPFYGIGVDKQ
jgi:hypothetical protein